MSKFILSERSYNRLKGVDSRLVRLVELAIQRTPIDFGVGYLGGYRTSEEQNNLFVSGYSKKDGYLKMSKHQTGEAVDLICFVGSDVVDDERMLWQVAGVMFSCASELGIKIRWGGNWANDNDPRDNNFRDLFHYELI